MVVNRVQGSCLAIERVHVVHRIGDVRLFIHVCEVKGGNNSSCVLSLLVYLGLLPAEKIKKLKASDRQRKDTRRVVTTMCMIDSV